MSKFRMWLLKLIAGDYSVVMNCNLNPERLALKNGHHLVKFNIISDGYTVTDTADASFVSESDFK